MSKALELIAAERQRQIEVEGWTAEHDDQHIYADLAVTAATLAVDGTDAYVADAAGRGTPFSDVEGDAWGLLAKHGYEGSKPNRIRALTIAGALIAAELDRLLREEGRKGVRGMGELDNWRVVKFGRDEVLNLPPSSVVAFLGEAADGSRCYIVADPRDHSPHPEVDGPLMAAARGLLTACEAALAALMHPDIQSYSEDGGRLIESAERKLNAAISRAKGEQG